MGQRAICLSLNMTANLFVIWLLISCERVMSQGQAAGDICAIQDTKGLGICKRVTDCPTVLEDLKKRKITHTRCGFEGKTEIVCCPYNTSNINSSPVKEGSVKYFVTKPIGNNQKTGDRLQSQRVCTKTTGYEDVINEINLMELPRECGSDYDVESVCCPDITFRFGSAPPGQVKRMRTKSQEKCKEFGKLVFENVTVLSPKNEEGITVRSDTCTLQAESYAEDDVFRDDNGYRVVVVGGEEAAKGEFPHMAVLGFDAGIGLIEWTCGATLISENYLLTAGHCINHGIYGDVAYARLGTNNIEKDGSGIVLSILERIPHPSYDPLINYDDIGLLKLNESVVFRTDLRPACLPTEFDGSEQLAIATGWGQTAYSGPASALLLKVTLEKFSFEECNNSYTADNNIPMGILKETQFCVGHRTEVKDTCQGDSGGPLQVFHSTQYCSYTIIGVTSFGKVCAQIGTPGVYTRVYSYLDWIEGIVWK